MSACFLGITKLGNKGITNWGRFYGLQIEARGITNRGSLRDFKLGQKDYKSGQGFQIGTKRFQIGAEFTNRGRKILESCQFHDRIIDGFKCFYIARNYKKLVVNYKSSARNLKILSNFKQWCD